MGWRQLMARIGIVSTIVGLCAAVPLAARTGSPARAASGTPIYLDPSYSFAERAADLVARLTPEQRASQLVSSQAPAISAGANPLLRPVFAGQTTLSTPANPGDTAIITGTIAGISPGATLTVDPNGTAESVTVVTVGSGPSAFAASLAAAANPGDTNIKVNFTFGMTVGHLISIDSGAAQEIRTIQTVGTAGATGTGVTLTAPLSLAHAAGATAQDLGTPTTVTPALTHAYPAGTSVTVYEGIPAYGWWNEALHGINAESLNPSGNAVTLTNTTSYPIDLSRAASWDPALTYQVAQAESDEAREVVRNNKFDLDFYSPTINLGRDPRWGRNDESYGEDPLLEADVAGQFVNGMEGKNQNGQLLPDGGGFYKTTTTLKHYAMNNTEGFANSDPNGRLNGSSNADDRSIREYYTMPFRKIVQADQNGAIMSSYNEINGVPSAANAYLNDTLMRETFGFQGYFTGDCDAVNQVNTRHHWQPDGLGHVASPVEQFAFTLGSGEDAECNAGYNGIGNYRGPTAPSTTAGGAENAVGMNITTPTGVMTQNDVDVSATRLFTNRMKLGEFNPDSDRPVAHAGGCARQVVRRLSVEQRDSPDRNSGPAGSGAGLGRRVAGTAEERDHHPQGRLDRQAAADVGTVHRPVQGARTRLLRQQLELLHGRLFVDPERGRPGQPGHAVRGYQVRDPGDRPVGAGRLHEGVHGHRQKRQQLLQHDRSGSGVGGGELRLRRRVRRHGFHGVERNDRHRGP